MKGVVRHQLFICLFVFLDLRVIYLKRRKVQDVCLSATKFRPESVAAKQHEKKTPEGNCFYCNLQPTQQLN
jgi:hypothetical protein